jgi:hypothetical protein
MTITRRGSRAITVDGVDYRWVLRRRPFSGVGLVTFVVEAAAAPGCTLVVRFGPPRLGPSEVPTDPVRRVVVARHIREALARGWRPTAPSTPFLLRRAERRCGAGNAPTAYPE